MGLGVRPTAEARFIHETGSAVDGETKANYQTSMATSVIGASVHSGWAELVTLGVSGRAPVLLDRRRVALIGAGLPDNPYHHEAHHLELAQAEALVQRVRASVAEHATAALVSARARADVSAVVLEASPYEALPDSLAEVLASWALTCAADNMMYRETFASCAAALGFAVQRTPRKADVFALAASELGVEPGRVDELVQSFGERVGPPWRKEHRLAAAAALPLLARLVPGGLLLR